MLLQTALIVEQVTPDSAAERAGLRPGYRLLSFQGQPLDAPATFLALEENAVHCRNVTIQAEWQGRRQEFVLEPGRSGIETRPNLPEAVFAVYERGRVAFHAQCYTRAAHCWSEAAEHTHDIMPALWLHTKAGEAWESLANWQQAQTCYTRAYDLWENGQSEPRQKTGYGKAEQETAEQKAADQKAAQHKDDPNLAAVAVVCMALGRCCQNRSDLNAATQWFARAQRANEQGNWPLWAAQAIHNQGNVAYYRSDLMAAHDHFARALALRERFAPDSLDMAASLNGVGLTAWKQGRFAQAQTCLTRTLRIREALVPNSLEVAAVLNNLGLVAWQQGDLERAQDHHAQALAIRERLKPGSLDAAMSLINLGAVAWDGVQLASAQDYYRRGLALCESLDDDSPNVLSVLAACRINLGNIAWKRKDLNAAQDHYAASLVLFERLAPGGVDVASSLCNLGSVAYERKEMEQAQDYYARALALCERIAPGSPAHANVLMDTGKTLSRQGRHAPALTRFQQAVEVIERQRASIAAPEARALLMAQHTAKYAALIQAYLDLKRPAAAFFTQERARARSLVEMLSERRLDFAATAPPELLRRQEELDNRQSAAYDRLKALASTAVAAAQIESLHRDLRRLEREQQELIAHMRVTSPHYASFQYPQPLSLREAQARLDPGTLLLSYLVDEEQTFVFAVTPKRLRVHILPIGRAALEGCVHAMQRTMKCPTLAEPGAEKAVIQGRQMYDLLIRPVHALAARAKRVLLCPDGPLHTLPFGALVTNPNGRPRYLGACKPLHSALSITAYAQMRHNPDTAPEASAQAEAAHVGDLVDDLPSLPSAPASCTACRVVAFGDPLYQVYQGASLPPLPHTRHEVEFLALLFPQTAEIKVGAEATKTAALQHAPDADILHFACHGVFDPKMPLSSGLLLSQPRTLDEQAAEGDNGLLQAWEIIQKLKLRARLIVLSACWTGLGQEVHGEGLIGLTRAFQYAGAKSLVVSLWDVNDASTSLFMQTFYTSLTAGESKDEAMRQGMRALQKHPLWKHPYYWSAFVLIGDRARL